MDKKMMVWQSRVVIWRQLSLFYV